MPHPTKAELKLKAREQGLIVSGTKDELIKRLEAERVAATLQGKFETALELRDECYNRRKTHGNDFLMSVEVRSSTSHLILTTTEQRFERLEKCLAECRTNLWRQAVAMGGITRLSQRDGMPPSPLVQLDTLAMDMVLKFVEAPYLEPIEK